MLKMMQNQFKFISTFFALRSYLIKRLITYITPKFYNKIMEIEIFKDYIKEKN